MIKKHIPINVTQTFFTPQTLLSPGTYRVWVRAISVSGLIGAWSVPVQFTITANGIQEVDEDNTDVFIVSLPDEAPTRASETQSAAIPSPLRFTELATRTLTALTLSVEVERRCLN